MTQWLSEGRYILCLALLQPWLYRSLWLKRRWRLYDCQNLIRGHKARPRPIWLLVGTTLVLGPVWLPHGRSIAYSDGCLYIFWYTVFITLHACIIILWPRALRFSWLLVLGLYMEDYLHIFMPPDRIIGGILFLSYLSVCLSVCLSVVNFNLRYNFWTMTDRVFIFGMNTPLMMPFQMTPRSMTLWPWLWPWS